MPRPSGPWPISPTPASTPAPAARRPSRGCVRRSPAPAPSSAAASCGFPRTPPSSCWPPRAGRFPPARSPMTDLSDAARLTAELVAVDSVNPALVPGAAGETEAARVVAEWAAAQGLRADVVTDTPGRPSVLVRGGAAAGGPVLMLCGHLDTVGHEGMRDPLAPRIEAGRLHGRGAYDMKGGLAAALVACRDADRAGI